MIPQAGLQTWLYDNLPMGVVIFDHELIYRYANAAYSAMQGLTVDHLLGQSLSEARGGWNTMVLQMIARARETRRPVDEYNVMLSYPNQPMLQRTWDITVLPIITQDTFDGFALYLLDVTNRQEAAYLSASEARLRSVLDVAVDAIVVIDQDGIIVQANPATSRIFGYTHNELIGQRLPMLMPDEFKEDHLRGLRRYLNTGIPHLLSTVYEVEGLRKDGSAFPIELSVAESSESEERRFFVGIMREITERKRLEHELMMERARLAAIFNTVPLPLYVIDPNGQVTMYNEAAHRFYGDEMTAGRFHQMIRLRPDTRMQLPSDEWPVSRALREGKTVGNVEQIVVFPDGREVSVLTYGAPVLVEGRIIAAVGLTQDLTELKAADRAKDAFLALITHELRSPLAVIISWTDLALEDQSLCEETLRIIKRNADTQRRIINDLLDVSRVLYGKLRLEKEPVDAWEIAMHTVDGLQTAIENQQIKLTLVPPEAPLPVYADPVRLEQVMSNLLVNAIKFTPAGGAISVEGALEDGMAHLRVTDTGIGIPAEQLPHIFERFQQLGRERVSGGLGLGLAVVKGIVELHGGRVAAESPGPGQGSTFTVWLPLRESEVTGGE